MEPTNGLSMVPYVHFMAPLQTTYEHPMDLWVQIALVCSARSGRISKLEAWKVETSTLEGRIKHTYTYRPFSLSTLSLISHLFLSMGYGSDLQQVTKTDRFVYLSAMDDDSMHACIIYISRCK